MKRIQSHIRRVTKHAALALLMAVGVAQGQRLERDLTFRNEMTLDPYQANLSVLPEDLRSAIDSGDVELRQLVQYDAPARRLSVRSFTVPSDFPVPTSLLVIGNTEVEGFKVDVSEIQINESARTLSIWGFVAENTASPVHGAFPGDPFRLTTRFSALGQSVGFSWTRVEIGSGVGVLTASGAGNLVIETTPNRPPVADAGPALLDAFMNEVRLDAVNSFDPDGEELDYKWHVIGGAATLRGCETPVPVLQLVQGAGFYEARLTVTDARGASATDTVLINYTGR